MKPTLAPDLHDNNDKLIFAIQRQIFFATYYRLANLGRIIPLQMAKRNTLEYQFLQGTCKRSNMALQAKD